MQDWVPPQSLTPLLSSDRSLDDRLAALMSALCEVLRCDRCFLYIRNPAIQTGQITHCYGRSAQWPDLTGATWVEDNKVAALDPLMALAFRTPEAIFVDDIETAGVDVINLDYERSQFGHRALIHAPIYHEGELYGILEPCVFEQPHEWTDGDRRVIDWVQSTLPELIVHYLNMTLRA